MSEPIAYLNGRFVPASQCRLPVYDLGIVLGAAVTDLLRTFNHRPYRMEDHVRRLHRSARYARIDPPVSPAETMEISRKLIEHNTALAPDRELALIYYMTAGENRLYAGSAASSGKPSASHVQHTFPLPVQQWRDLFLHGAHCVTPSPRHVAPQSLSSKIKHRNRLHMWIGDTEARLADPNAVGLYLDLDGNVTETGGSNFVIYRDGTVISPRRRNILWGISLTVLGEICRDMDIGLLEQDIQTYDVVNAEEAWMPTTPYCLGPVVKINGVDIGDGKPGPTWRKIIDRWSEIVGKDIYREITGPATAGA